MSGYQDSDSSDEDVCFGEYTIKEAKKDLQRKYVPRKINRRHTHALVSQLTEEQTSEELLAKNFHQKNKISSDADIKWSSEYVTANETTSTDKLSQNSEFLEKLTKVIDEPVSEASSYNTAFDRTNVDNVDIQYEDTFLARFKNQTFVLDNVHQTLVENTVISIEDSLHKAYNYDCQNDESLNEINNDSIINITDDSLESFSQLVNKPVSEVEANVNLKVLKDPILSNKRIISEELLHEATNDFISDSSFTKSQVIDHTNSLYDTQVQSENRDLYSMCDENNANKSSFAYESLYESLYVSDSDTDPKNYSCNINLNDSNESDGQDSPDNTSFDSKVPQLESLQRFERVIVDCKQLSKISEKTEYTTCSGDNSSMHQQGERNDDPSPTVSSSKNRIDLDIPRKYTEVPKRSTSLDVQSIDYISSSEVSNNSELYKQSQASRGSEASSLSPTQSHEIPLEAFDDTLEEINMLLEHGVNYQMPETKSPSREPFGIDKIISGSFMNTSYNSCVLENKTPRTKPLSAKSIEKCKKFYSAEKITKPSVERKWSSKVKSGFQQDTTYKPPSASATNLFTNQKEKLGANSAFKVPTKPIKKLATPSKLPKPTFKSAISPIGVYIKHSPKYCPMIRVPQHSGNSHKNFSKLLRPDTTSVKENIFCASNQEIPEVIYRPAKNREITDEKGIILPGSIRKLIKEQVVTKHERRYESDECNQSIDRRLMESDLSIDLNHSSQDMSILTNKQPFSIRKF